MKIKIFIISLFAISTLSTGHAQTLLAGWDFSNLPFFGPGASWEIIPANYGILKQNAKLITSEFEQLENVTGSNIDTFQVTPNDGTTVGTAGTEFSTETMDPAAISIFNAGVNGKGIVIEFSTKGYQQIKIKYAALAGTQGANSNQWQWSIDGVKYTNVGAVNNVTIDSFSLYEYNFSAVTELNNRNKVYLRYLLGGSTGTAAVPDSIVVLDNLQILAMAQASLNPVLSFFPTASDLGSENYSSPWLGNFNASAFPWIFHNDHGFLLTYGDSNNVWFYDLSLNGWFYTTPSIYPWLWCAQTVADFNIDWHFYFPGTKSPRYYVRIPQGSDPVFIAVP